MCLSYIDRIPRPFDRSAVINDIRCCLCTFIFSSFRFVPFNHLIGKRDKVQNNRKKRHEKEEEIEKKMKEKTQHDRYNATVVNC